MFFPRAMSEIELVAPSKDLIRVMRVLTGHGVFHQAEGGAIGVGAPTGTETGWQERAAAYSSLDRRVQVLMQTLGISSTMGVARDFKDVLEVETVTPALEAIENEVKAAADQLAEQRRQLEHLQSNRRQLEPVSDIDLEMRSLRESHYLFPILGMMPAANVARLQTSLARVPHVFMMIREDAQRPIVWLAGTQTNKDVLERAARSAYLEALSLPKGYEGTPTQIMRMLDDEIARTQREISRLEALLTQLANSHREDLARYAWEVHASRTLADAIVRFGRLRHTYVIVGWVPTDDLEVLIQKLRQASKEILIEALPANRAGDKRNVPVALRSSKFLRPFQTLVTTYARPRYGEIDPTWLIALTFPLLFGAMFGDVGHGLLLALFGGLISSRKVQALRGMASLGGLVTICGLLAAVFGVLYGSVFGYEDILPAAWLQPSNQPLQILTVAIGGGVVLLTLGFLIGIFNAIVSRNWSHLLFGHNGAAGFVLYWSLLGIGASAARITTLPAALFVALAVLGALAIMFSEVLIRLFDGERPLIEGGIGTYAVQAPMELFETLISFVSNSLSYVRVGAFAIAHVVLSSVVFLLAGLISPGHGPAYWIVLALGTVGIVLYEGLIVGIQAMRLSYYEFFSKFFAGGGMRFEPLTLAPTQEG